MVRKTVSGTMLTLLLIGMLTFAFFPAVEASEFGNEVKCRGIAISDEKWGEIVAYGSYYCEVTVLEVLYDPNSTLSLNDNVTIAYQDSLSLHIGDEVECYGINCINCTTSPKQCYGYIVCKPWPFDPTAYYVMRYPPELLLETDKSIYKLGENITITLTNISNETIEIGGYPAWQIFTYPEEESVYPKIFAFLAWSLDPGENDTFIWNQYNEFNESFCSPGTYVIKDTQGWGLSTYFKIIAAEIIVPNDYPTIQEAINAASPGDIIYVYGPYYYEEEVIVNKSVSLIGRFGPELISIDVVANDVYIQGFGFRTPWGFPYGRAIVLNGVSGCEILKVIVSGIDEGPGIVLTDASNNVIANSWVWGLVWDGAIVFESSSNNTIFGNTIEASWGSSIYLHDSSGNKFFHNQFYVYEASQVEVIGISINVWDDGYPSGGNYWSDYTGVDLYSGPYQNETGSDGIGDTPYVIDANNRDRYPLMVHDVAITDITPYKTVVGQGYSLNINVTAANQGDYTETFNVTVYTDRFYDPFDVWNYTGAWKYYDPYGSGAEGHVSVSNGMLHVSGYGPPYGDCGLTTIKEFTYPITVEAKLKPDSAYYSPKVQFGPWCQPGFISIYYDVNVGGWQAVWFNSTGPPHIVVWGGSLTAGTWYTLKLVVTETHFSVYLNDVLTVDSDWSPPLEYPRTVSLTSSYGSYGSGDFALVKIETEIGTKTVTITSGNSTTITFTWNTIGFAKGNYTIKAIADTVPGETDLTDNTRIDGRIKVTIAGDINGDRMVDGMDLTPMGMAWGSTVGQPNYNPNADLNGDGWVDGSDLTIMGLNWGQYDP